MVFSCRHTSLRYKAGFVLYFIDFLLSAAALMIPNVWFYETSLADHSHSQGRSVWFLDFPTCLRGANSTSFRCVYDNSYSLGQKTGAVWMMMAGLIGQLLVCAFFILDNCRANCFCIDLLPEVMAGCSACLSYGGLMLYIRYTHIAVNISYGPVVFLLAASHLLSGVAVLLTSINRTISPESRRSLRHARESRSGSAGERVGAPRGVANTQEKQRRSVAEGQEEKQEKQKNKMRMVRRVSEKIKEEEEDEKVEGEKEEEKKEEEEKKIMV